MDTKAWDKVFKEKGRYFEEPHEDMANIARLFKERDVKKVLDLGCGTGRHTVFFARQGFEVSGLDNSDAGLKLTRQWLDNEKLKAELVNQEMTDALPFDNGTFDAVISVQVIHHAKIAQIQRIISEISRILRKEGVVFITVPKFKNQGDNFKEIEPDTFIPLDGPEKDLPHHYFTPESLSELLADYQDLDIHLDQGQHFCVTAIKK